jgi:ubiquinone/menaquinone biosynthesis C-methylase UbiE
VRRESSCECHKEPRDWRRRERRKPMDSPKLYNELAKYYDKLNSAIDYQKEVEFILNVADLFGIPQKGKLLDVGCGTGNHLCLLRDHFSVAGIDANEKMLNIARGKLPDVPLYQMDMRVMELNELFNIIICMFGTINYNESFEELQKTVLNFKKHLQPPGTVIIDMEFSKECWLEGRTWITTFDEDGLQLVRILTSTADGDIFHYRPILFIKKNGIVDFETDYHKLRIFGMREVEELLRNSGFSTTGYDGFTFSRWDDKNSGRPVIVASL